MNNWKIQPGIVLVRMQGICFLAADREARTLCPSLQEINDIGAEIWEQMENGFSYEKILQKISETYDVPDEYDLEADVRSFIDSLKERHYILDGDSCL